MTGSVFFAPEVEGADIPRTVLDERGIRAVLWKYGRDGGRHPGSFVAALLEAFIRADEDNFARLYSTYPVEGYWMAALRFRSNGVTLAVRGLDLLGVKA